MGRLLACWSTPGSAHYRLRPMVASVGICQYTGQGDSADCTDPLHTDPITHQSSFPFAKAPFKAGQWRGLMWLKTVGWQYICHLRVLLSRACFFQLLYAVTTMVPNNATVYQNKKVSSSKLPWFSDSEDHPNPFCQKSFLKENATKDPILLCDQLITKSPDDSSTEQKLQRMLLILY